MSQSSGGGRETRHPQSGFKTSGTDNNSVTVKTVPNATYSHSSKKPSNREATRYQDRPGGSDRSGSRNNEKSQTPTILLQKNSKTGATNNLKDKERQSPISNHSQQATRQKRDSSYGDNKRTSKPSDEGSKAELIEVRTYENPREIRKSGKVGSTTSSSNRTKVISNGGSTHASSGRHSKGGRTFTPSDKQRNAYSSNDNRQQDVLEAFKKGIHDVQLCELLEYASSKDSKNSNSNLQRLEEYIYDSRNTRAVLKSGQSLWDAVLTLYSVYKSSTVQNTFINILVKASYPSIDNGSQNSRFIHWILKVYDDKSDEVKVYLMSCLNQLLKSGVVNKLSSHELVNLMRKLHNMLENAETGKVLVAVLENILYFASKHPNDFSPVFPDVVDILIGWYLDLDKPDDMATPIIDALASLQQYWTANIYWCRVLTGQFLEDAEGCCDESLDLLADDPKANDCIEKIILLFRVFKTLIQASGESFNHSVSHHVEKGYALECTGRIIECFNVLTNKDRQDELNVVVNDCIYVLVQCGDDLSDLKNLSDYMLAQIERLPMSTYPHQISILNAITGLLRFCDTTKLSVVYSGFQAKNLESLKLSVHADIQMSMLSLYHSLFSLKDMAIIQSTYQHVIDSVLSCLSVLSDHTVALWSGTRADFNVNRDRAVDLVVFNLACLSQAAKDTSNLILMYSLDPNIFTLLMKDVIQDYGDKIKSFPTLMLCVVKLLHLHSFSNRNFIAKSNLSKIKPRRSNHKITMSTNSGDNFSMLLESYEYLLSLCKANIPALVLLSKWMSEIVDQVVSFNASLLPHPLLINSFKALLSLDGGEYVEAILLNIADGLSTLLLHKCVTDINMSVIVDFILNQLSSDIESVRRRYVNLLPMLPVRQVVKQKSSESSPKSKQVLDLRRSSMFGSFGSLSLESFKRLAKYLFVRANSSDVLDLESLQTCLLSSEKPNLCLDQIINHAGLLDFWCLWQAADFCVAHRLRTPMGKPIDTFMAIEASIKRIAADKRVEVEPKYGADATYVWRLLFFLECLEKALYNAYEGTAGHLYSHSKLVKSFFRTNKGTCIEWLTRIRLHVLSIGSAFCHPTTVIRHSYELITDMVKNQSTQTPEFELVLIYLTDAFCKLHCSEAIQGLYEWCKTTCNKKLPWIKAIVPKAMQKYESATVELRTALENLISPQTHLSTVDKIQLQTRVHQPSPAVTQFCAQHVTNCYVSLQTWQEAEQWLNDFAEMKSQHEFLGDVEPVNDCDRITLNSLKKTASKLLSWSKEQHITKLWMKSLNSNSNRSLLIKQHKELEESLKIEACYDWPVTVHPNTILTLKSLSSNDQQIIDAEDFASSSLDIAWKLRTNQFVQMSSASPDVKLQSLLKCSREARINGNQRVASALMNELETASSSSRCEYLKLAVCREATKQMFASGDHQSALVKMIDLSCHVPDQSVAELVSRSTLTVAKWLQEDGELNSYIADEASLEKLPKLAEIKCESSSLFMDTSVVPFPEQLYASLLQMSIKQCSSLAKAHYNFGNWAYKWGRKCLDNADNVLMDEDREKIQQIVPKDISRQEYEDIISVMSMVPGCFSPSDEELADDTPECNDDDIIEIKKRLINCCPTLSDKTIDELVQLWTSTARSVYHLYESSATSYLRYLDIGLSKTSGYNYVTVTLRLLRLLVKHAWELRNVLEGGLAKTPTGPWKSIIPQLFSRLNHPESYVRHSVSELLIRLAEDYPHLIVYPAIVGCKQYVKNSASNMPFIENYANDGEGPTDELRSPNAKASLTDCFQQLVDTLSSNSPQLIQQVDMFVSELRRITVLWDELWLGSLGQLSNTAAEKIKSLASEVERVRNNSSLSIAEKSLLITEKRQAMVKPLIHSIERLIEITGQTPETSHEKWFQDTYGPLIEKGLRRLRNPSKEEDLQSDWQPFKQVFVALQQRSQKRSSHMLKMKDVSSVLSSLTDTYIPLPGMLTGSHKLPVTLQTVLPSIQILPTKTKPKKLAFLGSNGQKCMYLFKGLEDLHLDERIMQLLNIVNDMLEPKSSSDSEYVMYRARNYSVTPLGLRSGLIQWVDGCIPLFSLYKRWQVREAAVQQAKSNSSNNTVQRPSEVFYSKLIPLLKHALDTKSIKDIKDAEKVRKEWPLNTLVTATKQLIQETPSYLVAKEIWCSSTSCDEWWDMTQTYCRSVAVMSSIGYILGLGDRHLDNLLLDISNGEVVHIDYNVCFDKGKSLRVPERVPFRLTQNIVAAMGATGIEGLFRSASEHTVKCMRVGKETLLTLLEAFVYDPLVDWTVGGESGLAGAFHGGSYALGSAAQDHRRRKKQMERDITRSMFAIRVTEMKSAWLQNKDEMKLALTEIVDKLTNLSDENEKIETFTHQLGTCEKILANIDELKQQGGNAISQLLEKFDTHQQYEDMKKEHSKELHGFVEELSKFSQLHLAAVDGIANSGIENLSNQLSQMPGLGVSPSSFTKTFLQSVGQASQLEQLDYMHKQLSLQLSSRQALMGQCVDVLANYARVVRQFPIHIYATNHIMGDCLLLMKQLDGDLTLRSCEVVREELESNPKIVVSESTIAKINQNQKQLQTSLESDTAKLKKVLERSSAVESDNSHLQLQCESHLKIISLFCEENGLVGIVRVTLSRLVEINRRYLVMEGAASRAGDRLHSLTSRDGDWFLDELTCITENILEYATIIHPDKSQESQLPKSNDHGDKINLNGCPDSLYQIVFGVKQVYATLQDLIHRFQQIILPEAIAHLLKANQSVEKAVTHLFNLVSSTSLATLISKIETSLRNMLFGAKDVDQEIVVSVRNLKQGYMQIFNDLQRTAGVMLLKAFDGLFDHIFKQYESAMSGLSKLSIPKTWRKVDIIREAGELQQTQYNDTTKDLLNELLFVRKVKTMIDFFNTAKDYVSAIHGDYMQEGVLVQSTTLNTLYTGVEQMSSDCYEALSYPIKTFIAEFVRKQLIGVASQSVGYMTCDLLSQLGLQVEKEIELKDFGANSKVSIDDLCRKAMDKDLLYASGSGQVAQATSLINDFEHIWRRLDLNRRLLRRQLQLKSLVNQQQEHLVCYHWIHEEELSQNQNGVSARKTIVTELHRNLTALISTNASFNDLCEKLVAAESSIAQRLKWAAGANPKLSTVMASFESAQNQRTSALQSESALLKEINTICNSIIHLETMRTKSHEVGSIVIKCKQILDKLTDVCRMLEDSDQITEQQIIMISLMNAADRQKTGNAFLGRAHDACKSHMASLTSKVKGIKKSMIQLKEKYQNHVSNVQYRTLNAHHKLISEVRAVLKTLAKEEVDEPELDTNVQDYLHNYKLFSEKLATLLRMAGQQEITPEIRTAIAALVSDLLPELEGIFTRLIEIAKPLTTSATDQESRSSISSVKQESSPETSNTQKAVFDIEISQSSKGISSSSKDVKGAEKILRDPKTGRAVQERNSYAVSVWRRVKMKLDGRELDPNKRMSVSDQVNYIISEAIDIKNLAQMYEGWTSWV